MAYRATASAQSVASSTPRVIFLLDWLLTKSTEHSLLGNFSIHSLNIGTQVLLKEQLGFTACSY